MVEATEVRFGGKRSVFSQSLLGIKEMNIIDTQKNNLIIVLTKTMSLPNENPDAWKKTLDQKGEKLKTKGKNSLSVIIMARPQ